METLSQVMKEVNAAFDEKNLDKMARDSGFMKRKRKIEPKKILENLLCLRLESSSLRLDDLALELKKQECEISKPALHKKLNATAVTFLVLVLQGLLKHVFAASKAHLGVISFIKSVKVVDSSEIRLNKKLKEVFRHSRNNGAAVKLQAFMEVMRNQILFLEIHKANEPDQSYREHLKHVESGDLLIADLGYFCLTSFRDLIGKGAFFLSRLFKKLKYMKLLLEKSSI